MTPEEMRKLYEAHVDAVNRHDIEGVMATFHDDCFVEDLAFGLRVDGRDGVERYYERLFDMFPDAEVTVDTWAFGDEVVVACGTYRVTVPSLFLGFSSGSGAVDITSGVTVVSLRDGLVQGERIFLNLAALCDHAGVSLDKVRAAVRALMAKA